MNDPIENIFNRKKTNRKVDLSFIKVESLELFITWSRSSQQRFFFISCQITNGRLESDVPEEVII